MSLNLNIHEYANQDMPPLTLPEHSVTNFTLNQFLLTIILF